MNKVLIFSNRKGGVGKTTSVLNIGGCLSRKEKKVLLVDLDPQANLTQCFIDKELKCTLFPLILNECTVAETLVSVCDNLYLLPCGISFARFERYFISDSDSPYILKDLITRIDETHAFDYILLDCPTGMSLITLNAYLSGNEVYVPIEAQKFSYKGILRIKEEIDKIRKRQNPSLKLKGLFICRYNPRTILTQDIVTHLNKAFPELLMKNHIRKNIALEESPNTRQDIFQYDPNSHGAQDYELLTQEILNKHEE